MPSQPSPSASGVRADHWLLRTTLIEFGRLPKLMGIVNVTPDSFSDGGKYLEPNHAVAHALRLADEGADLLDIGGESTRPYSQPVGVDEQLRRVMPVIGPLAEHTSLPISIDTRSATVAREAVAAGAQIINDITGLEEDPDMLSVALDSQAAVCLMHMQGDPRTMQDAPHYTNPLAEVSDYMADRRDQLLAAGIDRRRICLDPGIGFGKSQAHNLTLLAGCRQLHALGCPILVGHSKKRFLSKLGGGLKTDRSIATIGAAMALAAQGVQILRVHDIGPMRQALLAFEACGGLENLLPGTNRTGPI
jgi:dihydropteroate synthase